MKYYVYNASLMVATSRNAYGYPTQFTATMHTSGTVSASNYRVAFRKAAERAESQLRAGHKRLSFDGFNLTVNEYKPIVSRESSLPKLEDIKLPEDN